MWCKPEWVEVVGAATSGLHCLRSRILDGETSRVKFNGHIVIMSELFDRDEIFNKRGGNKNIVEVKRGR